MKMTQQQIDAINQVKAERTKLLYYGEEAGATVMETYYRIIEDSDAKITENVNEFKEFVVEHNKKYLDYLDKKNGVKRD